MDIPSNVISFLSSNLWNSIFFTRHLLYARLIKKFFKKGKSLQLYCSFILGQYSIAIAKRERELPEPILCD